MRRTTLLPHTRHIIAIIVLTLLILLFNLHRFNFSKTPSQIAHCHIIFQANGKNNNDINLIQLSHDGTVLSVVIGNRIVTQWYVDHWRKKSVLTLPCLIYYPAISANGALVAGVPEQKNNTLSIWAISSGRQLVHFQKSLPIKYPPGIHFVQGNTVCSATDTGAIFWDIANHKQISAMPGSIPVSDRAMLIGTLESGLIIEISVSSGKKLRQFHYPSDAYSYTISPDNLMVAAGGRESGAVVWGHLTGKVICQVDQPGLLDDTNQHEIWAVTFSPDSKRLATGDQLGNIVVWDVKTGARLAEMETHSTVYHILFSPDNKQLIASGADGSIEVFDLSLAPAQL